MQGSADRARAKLASQEMEDANNDLADNEDEDEQVGSLKLTSSPWLISVKNVVTCC